MTVPTRSSPSKRLRVLSRLWNVFFFLFFVAVAGFVIVFHCEIPAADPLHIQSGEYNGYWQDKVRGNSKANVLILGDSRANQGIAPSILTAQLPGEDWRGLNLAFNWSGLGPEIYEFSEGRLDETADKKIVLVGIAPGLFTSERATNFHFHSLLGRSWAVATAYRYFPRTTGLLLQEKLDDHMEQYSGQYEFYDDGWQAALRSPGEDPEAWLQLYRVHFELFGLSAELLQAFMDQTRSWTQEGISVFAFRVPVSPAMWDVEYYDAMFNESAFADNFRKSGGYWIDIDRTQYRTYDNAHLSRSEAIRLSEEVGQKIAGFLNGSTKIPPPPIESSGAPTAMP